MPKPMILMNITDNRVYMAQAERLASGTGAASVMGAVIRR